MTDISTKTIKAVITNTTPTFKASIVQKGEAGKEVEFQTTATHIQWRYVDGTWADLVALADLKGPTGDTGNGIASIALTDGDHSAGTTDTYTITFTSGATTTFTVYNGSAVIDDGSVTLVKIADMPANTIIGRYTDSTGVPELLTIGTGFTLSSSTGVLKVNVLDMLIADDTDKALSAKQGKVLNTTKVDKVAGKSLVDDTVITDLTDGGDTTLHTHDDRYFTETEVTNALALKANKAQEAWITPTLLNGWGLRYGTWIPQYYKDQFGIVHMRGHVVGGVAGTVAFNLPSGYRLATSNGESDFAVGSATWGRVRIQNDTVIVQNFTAYVDFGAISYKAER